MKKLALHWQILLGLVGGAAIGIGLNGLLGDQKSEVPRAVVPKTIQRIDLVDTTDRIEIAVVPEQGAVRRVVVDPTEHGRADTFATVAELEKHEPQLAEWFHAYGQSWARRVGGYAQRLGNLFLRLLRMVAIPLIIASLVTGVLGLGQAGGLGRMFGRTALYYVTTSFLAIVTGLVMVNVIRPGLRGDLHMASAKAPDVSGHLGDVLFSQLENLIPTNPFAALAEANFLSIISFSLAFAIFATLIGGKTAELLRSFSSAVFDVMMAMTMAIIRLAPVGVFFLILYVTATQGANVFGSLAWYMLTVVCALSMHAFVTLPLILRFVAKRSPTRFAHAMSPALLTAFSSASSNGTLPLTLACVEKEAGVSNRVSSFVLPLGATVNMDGTALYEAVAVLFIAQLHYGANLPLSQQIIVAVTALLASVGAAGIPHAGLVMMLIILQAVGLPIEMQGIIIAVDRVLDMCRTSVNVWSDSCGCAVVARLEAS